MPSMMFTRQKGNRKSDAIVTINHAALTTNRVL
jgi:hypothetical protein